jgi:hypothetical protein
MKAQCKNCGSWNCEPKFFHLCVGCNGEGCASCNDNLVPGVVEGAIEEAGNIIVCSTCGDPEIDAVMDDTMGSLIAAVKSARDEVMAEEESADEAL